MAKPFSRALTCLQDAAAQFGPAAVPLRRDSLASIAALPLPKGGELVAYHDTLLFLCAYPSSAMEARLAERELAGLARHLKALPRRDAEALQSEGLPFTPSLTRFTHDMLRWLLAQRECRVSLDTFSEPTVDLNAVLKLTLPTLERSETTASRDNLELLDALKVLPKNRLQFLVDQLASLDATPYIKDQLFDALDIYVRVEPRSQAFSRSYNRIASPVFVHDALLKSFDHKALLNTPLPAADALDSAGVEALVKVIRNAMALTVRETDPATYTDLSNVRLYRLERGMAVALFGMVPGRQLPLESYVGFTLFKNGLPMAYGGSWVFGARAKTGINIFEPFRGGESGTVLCQVMRTYRQAFGVDTFEVEPYQYGADNPDGIASGAYWFYYKFGFRSVNAELAALAEVERQKMQLRKGYRSSEKTLIRFTWDNIELELADKPALRAAWVMERVTTWMAKKHGGNRVVAIAAAKKALHQGLGRTLVPANADEQQALEEVALMAVVMPPQNALQWQAVADMVTAKPKDMFAYQRLLLAYLSQSTPKR